MLKLMIAWSCDYISADWTHKWFHLCNNLTKIWTVLFAVAAVCTLSSVISGVIGMKLFFYTDHSCSSVKECRIDIPWNKNDVVVGECRINRLLAMSSAIHILSSWTSYYYRTSRHQWVRSAIKVLLLYLEIVEVLHPRVIANRLLLFDCCKLQISSCFFIGLG